MCSCLGFADGLFCLLMSAGIHRATAPPSGWLQQWRRSWGYCWSVPTLNTSALYFCHQRTEAKELHSWGWRAEAETGAQCQTHIRSFGAKVLIFPLCQCFASIKTYNWWLIFLFAVEDKVKDQLDAANPEPIIEEVVSKNIFFQTIYFKLKLLYWDISFPQDLANLAPRKPDWWVNLQSYSYFKICVYR